MTKYKFMLIILTSILLVSCKKGYKVENFTYKFSIENIGNFNSRFQLNPDKSYDIIQTNTYFDKFEGVQRPSSRNGVLTEEEFVKLKNLIEDADLNKMKDSYGFENDDSNNLTNIVYSIEISSSDLNKFVTINMKPDQKFTSSFINLIEYTNELIDNKISD